MQKHQLARAGALAGLVLLAQPQISPRAQDGEAEVEACRASALIALRETEKGLTDVLVDRETLIVAKANTKVEDTPIRTVITGETYLRADRKDKPRHMVCLIGEKGKVLLTFFTQR